MGVDLKVLLGSYVGKEKWRELTFHNGPFGNRNLDQLPRALRVLGATNQSDYSTLGLKPRNL